MDSNTEFILTNLIKENKAFKQKIEELEIQMKENKKKIKFINEWISHEL